LADAPYSRLITSQHRKPKFTALVEALTAPLIEARELLEAMRGAFDLDTGTGAQLDRTGLWIGRTRMLPVPLEGVFFQWGAEDFGWGEAAWKGLYDSTMHMVELPEETYRILLKAKVAANSWDGTIPGAYAVWDAAFADTRVTILLQDNGDMSMTVGIIGLEPDAVILSLLTSGYLPLKPEGVRIAGFFVTPDTGRIFALDADGTLLGGFDDSRWGDLDSTRGTELFAWNCDSGDLRGWGRGSWGASYMLSPSGTANADQPVMSWNCDTAWLKGWNESVWDKTYEKNTTRQADQLRWWGGRLRGAQTRVRPPMVWNDAANNGWAFGAWQ